MIFSLKKVTIMTGLNHSADNWLLPAAIDNPRGNREAVMTRKTLLILTLAHLVISSGTHASEPLRQPEIFSYNDEGVTQGTIRAAWSTVMVGDSQYESLVFNDKYDSPLIRTRPGGVIKLTLDNQMGESYMMDHSTFTFLVGADGHYLAHFPRDMPLTQMRMKIADLLSQPLATN